MTNKSSAMTATLTMPETAAVQEAYATIAGFFGTYGLASARRDLFKLAKAAAGTRPTRLPPPDVIWFFENLQALQQAAFTINKSGLRRTAAIRTLPDEVPDLQQFADYFGWHRGQTAWHFIPRFLSPKEYADPYRVFRKLAAYATEEEWDQTFRELRNYAFWDTKFAEYEGKENILDLFLLLNKLLEAVHLLEVRAITEVHGMPIPKWKGPAAPPPGEKAGGRENTTA